MMTQSVSQADRLWCHENARQSCNRIEEDKRVPSTSIQFNASIRSIENLQSSWFGFHFHIRWVILFGWFTPVLYLLFPVRRCTVAFSRAFSTSFHIVVIINYQHTIVECRNYNVSTNWIKIRKIEGDASLFGLHRVIDHSTCSSSVSCLVPSLPQFHEHVNCVAWCEM
jgi:hypothetical protein